MWKVAPLKSSFMMAGILGFLVSLIYTMYGRISADWGFALCFLFAIIVIASIISMTYAPVEMQIKMAPDLFKEPPERKPIRKKPAKRKVAKKVKKKAAKRKPAKKKPAKKKKAAKKKPAKRKPAKKKKRK